LLRSVAELAQAVVTVVEVVTGQDPRVQLTGGPVGEIVTGMEQALQQADDTVVVQLQAWDAPLANQCRFGERGQLTSVDRAGEQIGLQRQGAVSGGRQLLAQAR
jgi:hypothetical protein